MKPRVKTGAGSFARSLRSRAESRRTEIFVAAEISSIETSRTIRSRRSSSPKLGADVRGFCIRRRKPVSFGRGVIWFRLMLVRSRAPCKNSLRDSAEGRRLTRAVGERAELPLGRPGEERLDRRQRQRPVLQEGFPDPPPGCPARVFRDCRQRLGASARRPRHKDYVRLRRQAVVEEARDDAGIGVLPEGRESPSPGRPG